MRLKVEATQQIGTTFARAGTATESARRVENSIRKFIYKDKQELDYKTATTEVGRGGDGRGEKNICHVSQSYAKKWGAS